MAHHLLRELASESVDIGELIVAAKAMPEWDKAVEVEEKESWEALKEFDKQDKLEAEKRRKTEIKTKIKIKWAKIHMKNILKQKMKFTRKGKS